MHTGPVLCVRWAHSGRWLASGSDDEIVMIWDLDPFVIRAILSFEPAEKTVSQYSSRKGVGLRRS